MINVAAIPLRDPAGNPGWHSRCSVATEKNRNVMPDFNHSGFSEEQTSYLSGFVSGILQARDLPFLGQDASHRFTHEPSEAVETVFGTPIDELCREEVVKYEQNGLDCYDAILA